MIRYLKPKGTGGQLPVNPWEDFRAGTRHLGRPRRRTRRRSSGRACHHGSIVLISDLEILPDEVERLGGEIANLKREGISVRIVPLNPTAEKRAKIEALTGPSAMLRAPGDAGESARPRRRASAPRCRGDSRSLALAVGDPARSRTSARSRGWRCGERDPRDRGGRRLRRLAVALTRSAMDVLRVPGAIAADDTRYEGAPLRQQASGTR